MKETFSPKEQSKVRSEYFSRLTQYNEDALSKVLDKSLVERLRNRTASMEECLRAHDLLEQERFSIPEYPDLCHIMRNDTVRFRELTDMHVRNLLLETSDLIGKVLQTGVAPVLIRPEVFHLSYKVSAFLKDHGFEVVSMQTTSVDFKKYWALYEHVFGNPIKEAHVRRRAFGYIGRPACLLLVKHTSCSDSMKCSDLIIRKHKGKAGFKDDDTLRGGIIYDEVSAVIDSKDKTDALFALDPLMEYMYNDHTKYEEGITSVFHANLPGVHIPEPQEVAKDLGILLSREKMEAIIAKQ